ELVIETDRIEISLFSCLEVSALGHEALEGSGQGARDEAKGPRSTWCIAVECHPRRIAGNDGIRSCNHGRSGLDVTLLVGSEKQVPRTERILDCEHPEAVTTNT